jgi:hypothetical protein
MTTFLEGCKVPPNVGLGGLGEGYRERDAAVASLMQ